MGFDIAQARQDGIPDSAIADHFKQANPDFDVDAALKDGLTLDQIADHFSAPQVSVQHGASGSFAPTEKETGLGTDILNAAGGIAKGLIVDPVVLAAKSAGGAITHPIRTVQNIPQEAVGSLKGVGQAGIGLANMVTTPGRVLANAPAAIYDLAHGSGFNQAYQNLKSDVSESAIPIPQMLQPSNLQQAEGSQYGGEAVNLASMLLPMKGSSVLKAGETTLKDVDKAIQAGIDKGIKPTVIGKPSYAKLEGFYDKANDAVKTIAANKDALSLVDANGEAIPRPRSAAEMAQAIDQTKKIIYQKYNSMAKAAGDKGAQFDASPIIDKLDKIAQAPDEELLPGDPRLKYNPDTRKYANDLKSEIGELQGASPEVVESRIADLNNSLKGFYSGRVDKATAQVDGSVAQAMRQQLDDNITNATGPGYQDLKNQYGSLKAIETEVAKRALVNARKASKGVFDLPDIFTGGELIGGILTGNPFAVAKGATGLAITKGYKAFTAPDRYINNMFDKVWKYEPEQAAPSIPQGKTGITNLIDTQKPITDKSKMLPAPMIDNGNPQQVIQQQIPTMRQRYEAAGTTPGTTMPPNYPQLPAPGMPNQFQMPQLNVPQNSVPLSMATPTMRQRLAAIGQFQGNNQPLNLANMTQRPVQMVDNGKGVYVPQSSYPTLGTLGQEGDPFYQSLMTPKEFKKVQKEQKNAKQFNAQAQSLNATEYPDYHPNQLRDEDAYQMDLSTAAGFKPEQAPSIDAIANKWKMDFKKSFFPGRFEDVNYSKLSAEDQKRVRVEAEDANTDPERRKELIENGIIKPDQNVHPDDVISWVNEGGHVETKKRGSIKGNLFNQSENSGPTIANMLGVKYKGVQEGGTLGDMYNFSDPKTKSDFYARSSEEAQNRLSKLRDKFKSK